MEMKIMYGALIFVAGWFYFYICLRQLIFDFTVGYPLISKFGKAGENIFAPTGARRMNTISVFIWLIICVGLGFLVVHFAALYLTISFFVGAALGIVIYAKKLGPRTKSNFEACCRTYCRFVPDDDLRQAMAQAALPKMRAALRALGPDPKLDLDNSAESPNSSPRPR